MVTSVTFVYWHEITGKEGQDMPDADLTVMVYDKHLDDVVDGCIEFDGEKPFFADALTGEALVDPRFWAEKPFPEGI